MRSADCPFVLDDLSSARPRASTEPQKGRGSMKHVLTIRRGSFSNLSFLFNQQKLYSVVIGYFVCLPYLQEESLLEPVGSLTTHIHILTSHKWRELVPPGRLVCRCHDVFLWCYVCFVLFCVTLLRFSSLCFRRSRGPSFNRPLRHAGAPIATRFLFLEMSLFPSIFLYHFRFLFVWRVRRTFFLSEWCFFTL